MDQYAIPADAGSGLPEYTIRPLAITDYLAVHRMYESLSGEGRQYYHSVIYGKPSHPIWFPAQAALIVSYTPVRKLILLAYPKYVYFSLGAFRDNKDLIGFCSICVHGRRPDKKLTARLGIAIRDEYQGKKVGTNLMKGLISLAKNNNVGTISLGCLAVNEKAVSLYKKNGFRITGTKRNGGHFKGSACDLYEMELTL